MDFTDEIDTSELSENIQRETEKAGIKSCSKIIAAEANELRRLANLKDDDIAVLKQLAAVSILRKGFITAAESFSAYNNKWKNVSLDCSDLDDLLGGGIPLRGITELYGVSGSGKTQFGLQLAITVQYPEAHGGLESGCVYICTEDRFPSKRLQQILPHFPRTKSFGKQRLERAADNIFIDHIPDVESFLECFSTRLPVLLRNQKIGLIIVDSIAALFRSDYSDKQMIDRAKDLRTVGARLHRLANLHNLAILCINQVTDSVDTNETLPALGLAWANMVTSKLQTTILPEKGRKLSVISSPHLPSKSAQYRITDRGIENM